MKKLIYINIFLFSFIGLKAQELEWVNSIGWSGHNDVGYEVTTDQNGNVYTIGSFHGIVDFDPGPSVSNLSSLGQSDIFVQKLNSKGEFKWVKRFGTSGTDHGRSIISDDQGFIYVTGGLSSDILVAKLDTLGNVIWNSNNIGNSASIGFSIKRDKNGYLYVAGEFTGTTDFDPGSGVYNLTCTGAVAGFVQKLDSLGNLIWVSSISGVGTQNHVYCMNLDYQANIYLGGRFSDTVDFDPGPGVYNLISSQGGMSSFVLKLDSAGNFKWVRTADSFNSTEIIDQIVVDNSYNVYSLGYFDGSTDFDPGPGNFNLTANVGWNNFLWKLDSTGSFVWVEKIGDDSGNQPSMSSLYLDSVGNIYTAGNFSSTADFDPGVGTYSLTPNGSDFFIQKWDSNRNFLWCKLLDTDGIGDGIDVTIDNNDNLYVIGSYSGTGDFDPGSGVYNYTSSGQQDVFILKLGNCQTMASYNYVDNGNGNFSFSNTSLGNKFHWAFGDGNASNQINPIHTFSTNGIFPVVLTAKDTAFIGNCRGFYIDTISVTGVVNPPQCTAGFVKYPDTIQNNIVVINSSTGNNLNYYWDFGDGDTSNLQNPTHIYQSLGPFYLCLTVDDGVSCSDMYCDSVGQNGVVFKSSGFTINIFSMNTVGVNEILGYISLAVYPNPTKDIVNVEFGNELKGEFNAVINDMLGRVVLEQKNIKTDKILISKENIGKGVFLLNLINNKTGERVFTEKIVVQ